MQVELSTVSPLESCSLRLPTTLPNIFLKSSFSKLHTQIVPHAHLKPDSKLHPLLQPTGNSTPIDTVVTAVFSSAVS